MAKFNIYNTDCIQVLKALPDACVDMVLCDPPYGTTQNKWDNVIDLTSMWREVWRVLRPNGACVFFSAQPYTSILVSSQLDYYRYEWVWVKNLKTGNLNARRMPMGGHETLQVFYRKPPTYNPQKRKRTTEVRAGNKRNSKTSNYGKQREDYVDRQSDDISPDTALLQFKCVHNSSGKVHPTQKPVELLEYMINTYTQENEVVLDFTMGSGSTGVACANTGRLFLGVELDKTYFDIASGRIARAYTDAMTNTTED